MPQTHPRNSKSLLSFTVTSSKHLKCTWTVALSVGLMEVYLYKMYFFIFPSFCFCWCQLWNFFYLIMFYLLSYFHPHVGNPIKKRIHRIIFVNSLLSLASVKNTRVCYVLNRVTKIETTSGDSFSVFGLSCFLSCVLEIRWKKVLPG